MSIEMDIQDFMNHIKTMKWFSNCGNTSTEYTIEKSIFSAYDNWNRNMLEVWEPYINELEKTAQRVLSDEKIDEIFLKISDSIQNNLWAGYCEFIDRTKLEDETGLESEIMDCVKRDISWACIELMVNEKGFFHKLLHVYEQGRWPCSWDGDYPNGRFVVM